MLKQGRIDCLDMGDNLGACTLYEEKWIIDRARFAGCHALGDLVTYLKEKHPDLFPGRKETKDG